LAPIQEEGRDFDRKGGGRSRRAIWWVRTKGIMIWPPLRGKRRENISLRKEREGTWLPSFLGNLLKRGRGGRLHLRSKRREPSPYQRQKKGDHCRPSGALSLQKGGFFGTVRRGKGQKSSLLICFLNGKTGRSRDGLFWKKGGKRASPGRTTSKEEENLISSRRREKGARMS